MFPSSNRVWLLGHGGHEIRHLQCAQEHPLIDRSKGSQQQQSWLLPSSNASSNFQLGLLSRLSVVVAAVQNSLAHNGFITMQWRLVVG